MSSPPRGELASLVAILALPAPGAQVQALGRGEGPAVSAPVRITAVQIAGAVVGRLDRSVVAWCSGVASPARGW